jgi:hypothetical protein
MLSACLWGLGEQSFRSAAGSVIIRSSAPRFAAHFRWAHRVCEFAVGLRTKETTRGRTNYPHGVKRNSRGVMPVQRLNAWVKELTSPYPNSHAILETGSSRSAR